MKDLASPVFEYIYDLTMKDRSPGFVLLDRNNCIQDWGGNLDIYGITSLEKGDRIEDRVFILDGLFPLDDDRMQLPCVEMETGVPADIHIFSRQEGIWVLFLDATEEEARQVVLQQKANELCLLRDKHSKILDQYLGKEIAERLLHINIHEAGESKYVSVLFADICGFTSYSELKPPTEVFNLLNSYLAHLIQPILDEGGIVDKIIGDAVMAIFGIMPSELSPPLQSVRAAFRILENVQSLKKARKKEMLDTFDVGIGIATGQVFLGILGSRNRRTLSAIGHFVNLGARLEGQARPNEILICENTFNEINELKSKFSKTRLQLKGIREPIHAFSCEIRK
ncbi:MAG: adenylate/guanylate cyclase domain-containing protein [Desulfobacterales bacterium]|nr:adenylate/guanylate cyclase domain-containing protein [Desulfobacterales bacterium]